MKTQSYFLSSETKQAASILAKITFEKYRNNFGHYRNTANSHLVGHLGEFAAFIWLKDHGFNPSPSFLDPSKDREADIFTTLARIEVKTWSEQYWQKWGRCVSETQYASVKKKADLIFWLSVDEVESETPKVTRMTKHMCHVFPCLVFRWAIGIKYLINILGNEMFSDIN